MLDLIHSLRQAFSLSPDHNSLVKKLAQVKEKLKEAQLAETALRSQLETLNEGKDHIVSTQEEALKQQIEQHNFKISELESELSTSRKDMEKIAAERDDITSREQKLATDVKQLQTLQLQLSEEQKFKTALQEAKDRLQTQLSESQLMTKTLQLQMDLVQSQQTASVVTVGSASDAPPLKNSHQGEEKKLPELQARLDAALLELTTLKKQKDDLKLQPHPLSITKEQLKKKSVREDYAIGISLGDEILQMQAYNSNWGTAIERNLVLAGIIDAFHGQEKLSAEVLRNTLSDVSKREKEDQKTRSTDLDKATKKFLDNFTKMKKTEKSPSGFWYNIVYEGDTIIPQGAILNVVVKERLANGDVITDMELQGSMLTQPLSDFPPIFREALQKLKNHGSVTIVVPPELAYKNKGLPPKIPPNATMIYDLRISDMHQ